MMSNEVEEFLHRCFVSARRARMESITVEYMVLKMLDEPPILAHLKGSSIDLAHVKSSLQRQVDAVPVAAATDEAVDTQPTNEFQRVIQSAIMGVKLRDDDEVFLLDFLIAVVGDKNSFAARLLNGQDPKAEKPCWLCRTSVEIGLLTVLPGRGVICKECITAVTQLSRLDGQT